MTLLFLLLQFILCAGLIACAGFVLSRSAECIAKATGVSGGWIGLALLGTVTSLPELASGITPVTLVNAPDLAVGNALGACVFNLLFLVVIDAVQRKQPIYRDASAAHLLSATFGVVVLGFVAMSLLMVGFVLRPQGRVLRVFSWISLGLPTVYVLNATLVFLMGT